MGVHNFNSNSKNYCHQYLDGVLTTAVQDTEAVVTDALTFLTRAAYGSLRATTFTERFIEFFLRQLEIYPGLDFLVYACDHSTKVTQLKAETQKKRRAARQKNSVESEEEARELELIKKEGTVSVRASDGAVLLAGTESRHFTLASLVTVRAARKVLFLHLLQTLKKDLRLLSILKQRPDLVLCLDMGLDACSLWQNGKWTEHKEGVWGPTGQGEADVTCWLWASRLLALGTKSLTLQTIDTDFVPIGLLFLLRRELSSEQDNNISTRISFTNRGEWDLGRLYRNLKRKNALLPFIWTHAAMGTDFLPKKKISFRVPFPLVFRAAESLLLRLDKEKQTLRDPFIPKFCHFMLWLCRFHGEKLKLLPPPGIIDPFVLHHTWITTRSSTALPSLEELTGVYALFNSVLSYWYNLSDPAPGIAEQWASEARNYLERERYTPAKKRDPRVEELNESNERPNKKRRLVL